MEFAETTYGPGKKENDDYTDWIRRGNRGKIMDALTIRIRYIAEILLGVTGMNPNPAERITLRVDGENLVNKLLSLLRKVKEEKKMGRWVHMPPTNFEYNCYKILSVCSQAFAFEKLGIMYMNEWTRESFGIALSCRVCGFPTLLFQARDEWTQTEERESVKVEAKESC